MACLCMPWRVWELCDGRVPLYNPRTQESSCEGNRITNSHTFQFLSYTTKENGNPIMWRFYMNVNDSALLLFWHPHLFRFDLTLLFSFRKGEYNKSRERRRSSFRLFCFNLTCAACSWRFPRSLSPTDSINRYVVYSLLRTTTPLRHFVASTGSPTTTTKRLGPLHSGILWSTIMSSLYQRRIIIELVYRGFVFLFSFCFFFKYYLLRGGT